MTREDPLNKQRWMTFVNKSGETIPAYGVIQLRSDTDVADDIYAYKRRLVAIKPDDKCSDETTTIAFNSATPCQNDTRGLCTLAIDGPAWARIENDSGGVDYNLDDNNHDWLTAEFGPEEGRWCVVGSGSGYHIQSSPDLPKKRVLVRKRIASSDGTQIRKFELIYDLSRCDRSTGKMLEYVGNGEWAYVIENGGPVVVELYNPSFRGMAFEGDYVDAYLSPSKEYWEPLVGNTHLYGFLINFDVSKGDVGTFMVLACPGSGGEGNVINQDLLEDPVSKFVLANALEDIKAVEPQPQTCNESLTVEWCLLEWNDVTCEWNASKAGGGNDLGCGLTKETDENAPDFGKTKIDLDAIVGCGLKASDTNDDDEENPGCKIDVDTETLFGCGFKREFPENDDSCSMVIDPEAIAGCGLQVKSGQASDECKIEVKRSDLIGCGLKSGALTCDIAVDNTQLAGAGLQTAGDCQLEIDCQYIIDECVTPATCEIVEECITEITCETVRDCIENHNIVGCGLFTDGTGVILFDAWAVAGDGLEVAGECGLKVKAGCGITVDADGVKFDAASVASNGLEKSGDCSLAVKIGCGIKFSDGAVTVDNTDLDGPGLTTNGVCELKVDVGCGLEIDGNDKVGVKASDLAGLGLEATGGEGDCSLKVKEGCGIYVDEAGVNVLASDLAGDGLDFSGEDCGLSVLPGCGIIVGPTGVSVDNVQIAGDGLAADDECKLKVKPCTDENGDTMGITVSEDGVCLDCEYIKENCSIETSEFEAVTYISIQCGINITRSVFEVSPNGVSVVDSGTYRLDDQIPGWVEGNEQVLGHGTDGCLKWIDVSACA